MQSYTITVTGASGRLGTGVVRELHARGHRLLATDLVARRDLPVPVRVLNLLDREAVYALFEDTDVVVHLGNHPDISRGNAQYVFNENVTANMNVFQAASELGVKRMVFSSSIQVISGRRGLCDSAPCESELPYLPLDGDVPANPGNAYALSKQVTENMLAYYADKEGMDCVSVRFPLLMPMDRVEFFGHMGRAFRRYSKLDEAFLLLPYRDAARLVADIVDAELPGFRIYLPASQDNVFEIPLPDIVSRYYANVPLRQPLDQLRTLCDISRIVEETGWQPTRLPSHH